MQAQTPSDDPIRAALKAHIKVNLEWLATQREEIVEPELKIVDPHHHILDLPGNRYLFDDLLGDIKSGHQVVATVHVQAHAMYRADAPEEFKPVGETEFINGMAAQSASGDYGPARLCAGIVATTDLMLGGRVEPVLEAHARAGGERLRGIRPTTAWHESTQVRALDIQPHILMQKEAREAIACIGRHGLSLDLWLFFTQLGEAREVCRAFPELPVVINHVGGLIGIGPYADRREEVFREWRRAVRELADCPNAVIKLGGLGMRYAGFQFNQLPAPPSSDLMAETWRPYIDECIQSFGPARCMFESNFPVDRAMYNYHVLWNAFKKLASGYSADEKADLFHRTASRVYRLDI